MRFVAGVHARSEGNPFFVEELMAALPSTQHLRGTATDDPHAGGPHERERHSSWWPLPPSSACTLDQRLLEAVSELGADSSISRLAEVLDHQILVVDPEAGGLRFRHTLLYEAASSMLLRTETGRLHRDDRHHLA